MNNEYFNLEWAIEFIANRIRTLREAKGISAQAMSIELGNNVSYINKIENKAANPSIEGLFHICEYLEVDFDEFFDTEIKYPDKMKELIQNAQNLKADSIKMLIDITKKLD